MTIEIKYEKTVEEAKAELKEARAHLKNMKAPMRKASVYLDRWVQSNFKTEGGKVGVWKKLKAGGRWTGKGNQRRFDTSAKILQDTGLLKASFKPFATNKTAGIGSDLPYSKPHEEGKPQRRMLPYRKDVIDDIRAILKDHVKSI